MIPNRTEVLGVMHLLAQKLFGLFTELRAAFALRLTVPVAGALMGPWDSGQGLR